MPGIPTGTVTFVFTDIEGSTSLWENHPEVMQHNFTRQETLLRETFGAYDGYVYKMIGDAFQVAFAVAPAALRAAIEAQRRLQSELWEGESFPNGAIRVRMALHTGVTEERGDDYVGPVLNRIARLLSAGHGGQILLTQATFELVRDDLPPGVSLVDAGVHRLKDLIRPEHIYQAAAPGLMSIFPPLKTLDNYPHNLPVQMTSFVGREKEMAEVKQLFNSERGPARLVTLTGPGGTGKTRLSLHVAADLLENFPNGVWFVELAGLTDPTLVPQTIATALGIRESAGRSIQAALIEELRQKRLLLILDNCEHLVEACALVTEALLRNCPMLCILASSRELLGIDGELPYRVPSLSTPDTHHLPPVETLPQFDAVRLFIERATSASPGFLVTNSNAPAIAEICYRLDGIPLAIELVAARVAMLSIEQIAVRLDNAFRLLTGGSRTAMPRHQTLRALIDWSYDMLPPTEQTLLQRLSIFMGGWTLDAAEVVCADSLIDAQAGVFPVPLASIDILDLLTQLANKSLVQVEHNSQGEARYRLLETIRQYARELLANEKPLREKVARDKVAGEELAAEVGENRIRDQHMAYFLGQADQPEEVLRGPDQAVWIDRFEVDLDNIRAALEWALHREIELGLRAAAALLWFWHIRGYGSEGLEWLERLLMAESTQRGSAIPGAPRAVARARALNAAGFLHCAYEQNFIGLGYLEESLGLLQNRVDTGRDAQREIACAILNLGRYSATCGLDYAMARVYFEKALSIYQAAGARFGIAESLNELGLLETIEGHPEKATPLLEECLAVRRSIGDQDGIGFILATLSEFAFLQGDLPGAKKCMEESLETFQRSRNLVFLSMGLDFLSLITWLMDDFSGSTHLFEAYIEEGTSLNHHNRKGDLLLCKGNIALGQGRDEAAAAFFADTLAFGQRNNHDGFISMALLGLGRIAWSQGNYRLARQQFEEALQAAQKYDSKGYIGLIFCALGRVALAQGAIDEVLECVKQALPLFQMPFYHWAVVIGLEILAAQAASKAQYQQVARLYGAARRMASLTRNFHSPAEWAQLEDSVKKARARLGEMAFEQFMAEGEKMALEQAAEITLAG